VSAKFNDLLAEKDFLKSELGFYCSGLIDSAISKSDAFTEKYMHLLQARLRAGWFRDCHGDLHTRNIFLLPRPVIFDCIEFNDDYRQIDVLNEVAFLCMDLDAAERPDLSELFINTYNSLLPTIKTEDENKLFIYYKCYRANVRAKVSSLRAKSSMDTNLKRISIDETARYLHLMNHYLTLLD
jgi:aminoglycoside phosphotransferase family enzyme